SAVAVAKSSSARRELARRRVFAATRAGLGAVVDLVVPDLKLPAAMPARDPPRALEDLLPAHLAATVGLNPLLDVPREVLNAEGARALLVRSDGRAMIDELSGFADVLRDVDVARGRVAVPAVRVGAHLFALAGELPLALFADAAAL